MEKVKTRYNWSNLTLALGNADVSQERRAAYEAQALKEGLNVTRWARKHLDKQSGFKAPEQAI